MSKAISQGVMVQKREVKEDFRIADVSTKSIEAYRYFLEGVKNYRSFFWGAAISSLEKAVQLDPDFATAYYHLAKSYDREKDKDSQRKAIKKALSLSDRATEKEALQIQTYYAWHIERDAVKGFRLNEELVQRFPKEKEAYQTLAVKYRLAGRIQEAIAANERALELDPYLARIYNELGYEYALIYDYPKAERSFQKYIALTNGEPNAFDSMGDFYFITGRLNDAVVNYELGIETAEGSLSSLTNLAFVHALKEDYKKALQQFEKYVSWKPAPGWLALEHRYRGLLFFYLGRYREALDLFEKQMDLVEQFGDEMGKADAHELASFVYAESGRFEKAASELQSCLKSRMRVAPESGYRWRLSHQFLTGLIDVREGDLGEAKQQLSAAKEITSSAKHKWNEFGSYWCVLLEGEINLAQGPPSKAVQIFKDVSAPNPWYLAWSGFSTYRLPVARDGLARAFSATGDLDKAIAEYRRLITFDPDSKERFLIDPRYYYRLGKLYEDKSRPGLAIQEYEKFLEIWKNADPDLPDLIDARQRLTKLQGTSKKIRK